MQVNYIDLKFMLIVLVSFSIKLSTQFVILIIHYALKYIYQIKLKNVKQEHFYRQILDPNNK